MIKHRTRTLRELFGFQLFILTSLLLIFAVQITLIFPFEKTIFPEHIVELVSLLYLPFGLKIIFATFAGSLAVAPIFVFHAIADLYFGNTLDEATLNGLIAVVIVYLPIVVLNFVSERPLMAKLNLTKDNINISRVILALAFTASVLNAFIQTLRFQGLDIDLLAFRYLVGDLGGTVVLLILLVLVKQPIIRFVYSLESNK